jgi:AraC-like DNA-binding protein
MPEPAGHRARWRELLACFPRGYRASDAWAALRARGWLDLLLGDYLHAGFAIGAFAPSRRAAPAWLEDLHAIVRTRCPESGLTVTALARAAGYSASHLTHAFRAAYGESLVQYLQRCRMELAGKLAVQQPHLSIRELAALCGYTDRSAFSRRYAATWGVPPRPRPGHARRPGSAPRRGPVPGSRRRQRQPA